MSTLNFDNYLIHASAYSKLLTQPKSAADKAAGLLSATTKTHLRENYIEEKYGRKKTVNTKQMEKGTVKEEEAITLYCKHTKKFFKKNELRLNNAFITGEPDILDNEDIMKTHKGVDIKCSWDVFTFPFPDDKLDPNYESQNQNYMFLIPSAQEWATAYCLVNAPGYQITDEKKKLYFRMSCPADNDPHYLLACMEIEKNMIFNMADFRKEEPGFDLDILQYGEWTFDIPDKNRVREFGSVRDQFFIADIPLNVNKARQYMNGLAALGI